MKREWGKNHFNSQLILPSQGERKLNAANVNINCFYGSTYVLLYVIAESAKARANGNAAMSVVVDAMSALLKIIKRTHGHGHL